jgi:hypothetical protein
MKNIYSAFDVAKLKRFLITHGEQLQFKRKTTDDFGEPIDDGQNLVNVKGVVHQDSVYIGKNTADGTQSRVDRQPQILMLIDSDSKTLTMGDVITHNNKDYQIIAKNDMGDFGSVYDVSLELIDNGR